jgi:hypothetical protein
MAEGELKKLSISPCDVDDSGNVTVNSDKFEVMLNPSSYNHSRSIKYNKTKAQGQIGSDLKFESVGDEKVSFDLVLDGTGVVPPATQGGSVEDVKTQLQSLTDIVYAYSGEKHEPSHVQLLWGSLIFYGRLESMTVDYTLFKPSGEPLRAKVKLAFVDFMTAEEEALRANRSSPDLTHQVVVKAGDTLPLLCYKIYQDCSYYLDVARFNGIHNFRDLKPGTRLYFPPLR